MEAGFFVTGMEQNFDWMLLLSFYSEEPVKLIKISSIPEGISDSVVFCYWRMVACFFEYHADKFGESLRNGEFYVD